MERRYESARAVLADGITSSVIVGMLHSSVDCTALACIFTCARFGWVGALNHSKLAALIVFDISMQEEATMRLDCVVL